VLREVLTERPNKIVERNLLHAAVEQARRASIKGNPAFATAWSERCRWRCSDPSIWLLEIPAQAAADWATAGAPAIPNSEPAMAARIGINIFRVIHELARVRARLRGVPLAAVTHLLVDSVHRQSLINLAVCSDYRTTFQCDAALVPRQERQPQETRPISD
jgi:hypothetical protein